jgi:hypothetical protein
MADQPSSWAVGWAFFASVMLMIAGMFQIIVGGVGLAKDDLYVVGQEWVFQFDTTQWGWVHLILGAVLLLVGIGILTGNLAARIVGVIVASVSMIVNFAWLPWYPVWAILVIAIDIAIIWALTAHGRDVEMVKDA